MANKVCIDPGHAGHPTDPGAKNPDSGMQEANVVLDISARVQGHLQAAGCCTLMTRTSLHDPATHDLDYRVRKSNEWGADLFLSIHCNSAGVRTATGIEIWTYYGQTHGDLLATKIMDQIRKTFPELTLRADWADGDVDKEAGFQVLRDTDAPACLLELPFINNNEDAALLADENWREEMAKAIARGVTDFLVAIS